MGETGDDVIEPLPAGMVDAGLAFLQDVVPADIMDVWGWMTFPEPCPDGAGYSAQYLRIQKRLLLIEQELIPLWKPGL